MEEKKKKSVAKMNEFQMLAKILASIRKKAIDLSLFLLVTVTDLTGVEGKYFIQERVWKRTEVFVGR